MEYTKEAKKEFVERTKNLIDNPCDNTFNVTKSVNLALGLILIPREALKNNKGDNPFNLSINRIKIGDYVHKMSVIEGSKEDMCTSDILIMLRNGLAHGNIEMASTADRKEIEGIKILGSKSNYKEQRKFEFTVDKFKEFVKAVSDVYITYLNEKA